MYCGTVGDLTPQRRLRGPGIERFGFPLFQLFGLIDGGIPVYDDPTREQRVGACGRVIDEYQVRIVDSDGHNVPTGQIARSKSVAENRD
jgi:hypothetical protein